MVMCADFKQKRLYQYSYQEHYWQDLTDEQREINRLHNGTNHALLCPWVT